MKRTAAQLLIYLRNFRFKSNRKFSVFLICVFIASGFWLLNALTKTYEISLAVPIAYQRLPQDRVILNRLPREIIFSLEGDGFNLLGVEDEEDFDTLKVDLSRIKWQEQRDKQSGVLNTQFIKDQLATELSGQIRVTDISIDSFTVVTDVLLHKKVNVYPLVVADLGEEFVLKSPLHWEPKAVELYGPKSFIEVIDSVATDKIELKKEDGVQTYNVPIMRQHPSMYSKPGSIQIKAEVESISETTIKVPITTKNTDGENDLKVYPSVVEVTCALGLSKFETLNPGDFKVYVDYNDVKDRPARLNVYAESLSKGIVVRSVKPERVEYIIRKR